MSPSGGASADSFRVPITNARAPKADAFRMGVPVKRNDALRRAFTFSVDTDRARFPDNDGSTGDDCTSNTHARTAAMMETARNGGPMPEPRESEADAAIGPATTPMLRPPDDACVQCQRSHNRVRHCFTQRSSARTYRQRVRPRGAASLDPPAPST